MINIDLKKVTIMPNGGGADIKNQTKSVNFTSNGRKIVEYDEGYTGLETVNINVAVPSSGGGGTTNDVIDTPLQATLQDIITEVNVSKTYPNGGINNTDKYSFTTAVTKIPIVHRCANFRISYKTETDSTEEWIYTNYLNNNVWDDIRNWVNVSSIIKNNKPLIDGLPMLIKDAKIGTLYSEGYILTPEVLNLFFLDFKVVGTPKEGMTYFFYFQYDKNGIYNYSNWLALYEVNSNGKRTLIGTKYLGSTAPSGKHIYHLDINNTEAPHIKDSYVYLNYDALNNLIVRDVTKSDLNACFDIPYNYFNQQYIFDVNTGVLAEINKKNADRNDLKLLHSKHKELYSDVELLNTPFDKLVDEKLTKIALTFTTKQSNMPNYHNSSTFSGYGEFIGEVPTFRYLSTIIHCSEWVSNPKDVEKVLVQFKQDTKQGVILKEKLFILSNPIKVGEDREVILDFEEDITLSGNIFLCIRMDSFAVLKRDTRTTYPSNFKEPGCYWTYGNINSVSIGNDDYSKLPYGDLYWQLYSTLEYKVNLTDEQIVDIKNRLEFSASIEKVEICLPDKIYAIVGDTLQLFYRGMIKAVNPLNYNILVTCSKGNQYPRYFEYKPTVADVGETTFTLTVKNNRGQVLGTKKCKLITKNHVKAPSQPINVLCFGDSLTSSGTWCTEAHRRLTKSNGVPQGLSYNNISFVGAKKVNDTGYFGVGGWTWNSYTATEGVAEFRFKVSGLTSASYGAVYTHNGFEYRIMEVNVTEGNGTVLGRTSSQFNIPLSSGVLTKKSGDGDVTINFSSYTNDSKNPLWDNGKMSFIPYANTYCNGKIDVVYTLLSWNGHTSWRTDFSSVIEQVKVFANTLHKEFPNAKLKILGLQVPSVTGGMGANYGASGANYADTYGMTVTAFNQNKAYQDFANLLEYSSFVEYVDIASQFDTEYSMPYINKAVNVRNTKTELIGTNGVHPNLEGQYQIGDVVYRNFISNFCQ